MKTPRLRRLVSLIAALLLLATLTPVVALADGVIISGTVYYSTTPLSGVAVELRRDSSDGPLAASTTSGATGGYEFSGVTAGTYYLNVYGPTAEYVTGLAYGVTVVDCDVLKDLYLEKKITLLEPAEGSVVNTASPRFCWAGLPEAAWYRLQVNRSSDWATAEYKGGITETCYTTTTVLDAGVRYTWMVEAGDSAGHRIGRTSDTFCFTYWPPGWRWYLPLALR